MALWAQQKKSGQIWGHNSIFCQVFHISNLRDGLNLHLFHGCFDLTSLLFVLSLPFFHALSLDPSLKQKSTLLKVRQWYFPLQALSWLPFGVAIDVDAGCLLMLYGLPLGRSIVSLDCGYKWLPGAKITVSWVIHVRPKRSLFYLLFILSCLSNFISVSKCISLYELMDYFTWKYIHAQTHGNYVTVAWCSWPSSRLRLS